MGLCKLCFSSSSWTDNQSPALGAERHQPAASEQVPCRPCASGFSAVKWGPRCSPTQDHAEGGARELHPWRAQSSAQPAASTQRGGLLSTTQEGGLWLENWAESEPTLQWALPAGRLLGLSPDSSPPLVLSGIHPASAAHKDRGPGVVHDSGRPTPPMSREPIHCCETLFPSTGVCICVWELDCASLGKTCF